MRITLHSFAVCLCTAVATIDMLPASAHAAGNTFTPGHIYTPYSDGTVFEWDMNLNPVGSFSINTEIVGATGATFGANGNLVMLARKPDGLHVIEVNARGRIIHSYDTDHDSLLIGAYIDYDPISKRYAFANDDRITILDSELNFIASTSGFEFDRASGVAWREDGGLYATDQLLNSLVQFGPDLAYTPNTYIGGDGGIDRVGDLLYMINDSDVRRYDALTNSAVTLFTIPGSPAIDIRVLADGNLLTSTTSGFLRLYSQSGQQLDFAPPASSHGASGMAYFVPSPPAALLLAGIVLTRRRKRSAR